MLNNQRFDKISVNSHIKTLSLNDIDGIIGQEEVRKALLLIKNTTKTSKNGLLAFLFGKPCTGKRTLIYAMMKDVKPVFSITANEMYNTEISKTEYLYQSMRKAISVKIEEEKTVLKGEVIELRENVVSLKTRDMEGEYNIGIKMQEHFRKERISVGDVIQIVKESGMVTKLGKTFVKSHEYDAVGPDAKFIYCPEGEILRKEKFFQELTLHELDILNSGEYGHLNLHSGIFEIPYGIREAVDSKVNDWILEGKAEIKIGILHIDEIEYLDEKCYSFLIKLSENERFPVIILTSDKEEIINPLIDKKDPQFVDNNISKIPEYFAERILLMKTKDLTRDDMLKIIKLRCIEENIKLTDELLDFLVDKASLTNLRYVLNVLSLKSKEGNDEKENIKIEDFTNMFELFT